MAPKPTDDATEDRPTVTDLLDADNLEGVAVTDPKHGPGEVVAAGRYEVLSEHGEEEVAYTPDAARDRLEHIEVKHHGDGVLVVADTAGYELNEWADAFEMPRSELSALMHDLARQHHDRDRTGGDAWSVHDPLVFVTDSEVDA